VSHAFGVMRLTRERTY